MADLEEEEESGAPIDIEVANYSASGASARQCAFLAMRFDSGAGYRPGDGETWVGLNNYTPELQGLTRITNGTAAWYTKLWSTLAGSIYITRHDGWIIRNPDIRAADALSRWHNDRIEGHTLRGVFGIDDANVFVWGHDPRANAGKVFPESAIFRWDGRAWVPMTGPGFHIMAMHGSAADDLWVGGPRGSVARWDGSRWNRVPSRRDELINSLWVVGPDEVYATTTQGSVLESSSSGMIALGPVPGVALPGDVACVAKWNDALWVGASRLGLFRRIRNTREFESIKPNIDCVSMDARDELVLCCNNRVSGTSDGARFRSFGVNAVLEVRGTEALGRNLG